jgi:hypothetical protein
LIPHKAKLYREQVLFRKQKMLKFVENVLDLPFFFHKRIYFPQRWENALETHKNQKWTDCTSDLLSAPKQSFDHLHRFEKRKMDQ